MTPSNSIPTLLLTAILMHLLVNAGCDDGAAQIAREAADRQARQNETMAQLQGHVAAGTKQLAAEDAASRRDALALQRDFQAERAELNAGWNDLESQRQSIAQERRTSSFLAVLVKGSGALVLAALTLAFAALALFGLCGHDDATEVAVELLLDDLAPERRRNDPDILPPTDADSLHRLPDPNLEPRQPR